MTGSLRVSESNTETPRNPNDMAMVKTAERFAIVTGYKIPSHWYLDVGSRSNGVFINMFWSV